MLTTDILATVTKAGKASNLEEAPNDFFEMVPVLIPSTTPSMKSCRCIKISYQVKVSFMSILQSIFCFYFSGHGILKERQNHG